MSYQGKNKNSLIINQIFYRNKVILSTKGFFLVVLLIPHHELIEL